MMISVESCLEEENHSLTFYQAEQETLKLNVNSAVLQMTGELLMNQEKSFSNAEILGM